jgi:hypothetical protein
MRSIVRNALLAAGAMLLGVGGTALASPILVMKADIKFPFEVNGQQFPAGTYFIQRDDMEPAVMQIRSANFKYEAFFTTIRDGGKDPVGEDSALTFKKTENQYRLVGIWESEGEGFDLPGR